MEMKNTINNHTWLFRFAIPYITKLNFSNLQSWQKSTLLLNIIIIIFTVTGILKKWQLIFYGTATNPIRIRTRQFNPVQAHSSYASAHYPFPVDDDPLALGHRGDVDFFPSSTFQGYQGYPYVGAASNVQASVATLDGSSAPILTNRLPGDTSSSYDSPSSSSQVGDDSLDTTRKILHDCDPQCDSQGCYGKGPTQCIACKNYRLDK